MIAAAENDYSGFPVVQLLQFTCKLSMSLSLPVELSQKFVFQKSLKSVDFRWSYSKCYKMNILRHSV